MSLLDSIVKSPFKELLTITFLEIPGDSPFGCHVPIWFILVPCPVRGLQYGVAVDAYGGEMKWRIKINASFSGSGQS